MRGKRYKLTVSGRKGRRKRVRIQAVIEGRLAEGMVKEEGGREEGRKEKTKPLAL